MFDLNAIQTQLNSAFEVSTPTKTAITDDYYSRSALFTATTTVKAYEQIIAVLNELNSNSPDLDTLYSFPGFGWIRSVFDTSNPSHQQRRETLERRLSPPMLRSAKEATLTSFYTSHSISNAIVEGLSSCGFSGGRILDPACGANGRLIAPVPNELKADSDITLIEYDSLSAEIAQQLYPSATMINRAFQDVELPLQDVVLANPPFNNVLTSDRSGLNISGLKLHDFFVIKSLRLLREGGVFVAILPTSFLDSKSANIREQVAQLACLKGGVRIGYQLFEAEANTKTAVDVLIFQAQEKPTQDFDWINSLEQTCGTTIYHTNEAINNQNIANLAVPENGFIIGKPTVLWSSPQSNLEQLVSDQIFNAFHKVEYTVYEHTDLTAQSSSYVLLDPSCKPYTYQLTVDGELVFVSNQAIEFVEANANSKKYQRITGISSIVKVANELICEEGKVDANQSIMSTLRAELNRKYDAFVSKYGFLSNRANSLAFKRDRDMSIALALEHYTRAEGNREETAKKALIFSERAFIPYVPPTKTESVDDALWVCLTEKNRIDIETISDLCGQPEKTVLRSLAGTGTIFRNPESGDFELRSQYLSGDVKSKLEVAQQAAKGNPIYDYNVTELNKVVPADVRIEDISAPLFAHWIPSDLIESFLSNELQFASNSTSVSLTFGVWNVNLPYYSNTAIENSYGTEVHSVAQIIKRMSVFSPLIVKLYDADGKTIGVNKQATAELRHAAQLISNAWLDYITTNKSICRQIEVTYNSKINRFAKPALDHGTVTLPNTSKEIALYRHQIEAVQRSLLQTTHGLLLNYAVGAGKTFSFCAMANTWVRLGLKQRVCLVVPNHLVNQTLAQWVQLYPNDRHRIMVLDSDNMSPSKRLESLSRLKTSKIPFVIVPLSTFGKIAPPAEHAQQSINARLDEIENLLLTADERYTVRALETAKKTLKEQFDQVLASHSEFDFASLGFDSLILDEAQCAKNAGVSTRYLAGVKGLGTTKASKLSLDIQFKTDYIHSLNHSLKGVVFSTGTVLNNSLVELYAYKRFLAPKLLTATGHTSLDAWATTYAKVTSDFEVTAQGTVRQTDRVNSFHNLPELYASFAQFSITLTKQELNELLPPITNEFGQKFPAIVPISGDKPTIEIVKTNDECASYMKTLVKRAENFDASPIPNDNSLLLISDSKKAAVSPKMVDVNGSIFSPKTLKMLDNIVRIYDENPDCAQLAFVDIGTPDNKKDENEARVNHLILEAQNGNKLAQDELNSYRGITINLYRHMADYLIASGVDPDRIAFAQNYETNKEKQEFYEEINTCKKRVVFSTCKRLSTGANVQRAIKAVHILTPPLIPSDLEQSIGRAIRQGNERYLSDPEHFGGVEVILYALEKSADAFLYQLLQSKQSMIDAFATGNVHREIDVGTDTLTYAEIKAEVTGNKDLIELLTVDKELQEQVLLKKAHIRKVSNAGFQIEQLKKRTAVNESICDNVTIDLKSFANRIKEGGMTLSIGSAVYSGLNKSVADKLWSQFYQLRKASKKTQIQHTIGEFVGFDIVFESNKIEASIYLESKDTRQKYVINKEHHTKATLLPAIVKKIKDLKLELVLATERITEAKKDIDVYKNVSSELFDASRLEYLQKRKFNLESLIDDIDLAV